MNYRYPIPALIFLLVIHGSVQAQDRNPRRDTLEIRDLDSIWVKAYRYHSLTPLPEVKGVYIYSGKKSNQFYLNPAAINLAGNVSRNAFARIPGINVWDMDGGGTQFNIGTRGTNAHRSIEMNVRQNGYNTNSDMFGYPEDHYTPPLQGIRYVELVRGSAALQFGSQFGGMLNFVLKDADSSKPFSVESEQSAGSNHFFNSFNAIGGTKGKWSYYGYFAARQGDGWRKNAAFQYHAGYANIRYHLNDRGNISFQFSRMDYVQQTAGGLTDEKFKEDNRQSTRSRNYFSPAINIPAIKFFYQFNPSTRVEIITHALFGQRNSVMFIAPANIADTVNTALGDYNPRQVDRDYYHSFTTEARVLQSYHLGKMQAVLSGGLRYYQQMTRRKQKGPGTAASDFDLSLTGNYATDLTLHSQNGAIFFENLFKLTDRLSMTPGFRYEHIQTRVGGSIQNNSVPVSFYGTRDFTLWGMGLQYQLGAQSQFYANWSQAYRPFLYANVTPADRIDKIDPGLKDSKGYDIDLGFRGHYSNRINYDVNVFNLYYGNHVGLLSKTDNAGNPYLLTTNVGNSVARGVELFFDVSLLKWNPDQRSDIDLRVYNSLSYTHARYTSGLYKNGLSNISLKGNYVEGTPEIINRTGVSFLLGGFETSLQVHYVGKSYSDAGNTVYSPGGSVGVVPAYHVWDWSCRYVFLSHYHVSVNINNLLNEKYFTRRITTYPGPGILPADGRTFNLSLGLQF